MTKDIATVKAALECTVEYLEGKHEGKVVVSADVFNALYDFAETALSSPPAAPAPENNGWRDISTAPRDGTRQAGKGALQDILMMAHIRAVETRQIFMLPSGDDCLEVTVVRKKTYGGKEITTLIYDELEGLPTPPPALDKGE